MSPAPTQASALLAPAVVAAAGSPAPQAATAFAPEAGPGVADWGALLDLAGEGVALKEAATGRYVHVNSLLLAWMGRKAAEVIGRTDGELFEPAISAAFRAADQAALAHGVAMAAEHRVNLDGRARELALWRAAVGPQPGPPRWLLSVWSDSGERRQHEGQLRAALAQIEQLQSANQALRRELADQALRDPASGLYAKAHFEDQLRREADLSGREHREFSIVFVEIDEPAAPERAHSPQAAQAVQAALGRLLRGGTRAMDAASRLDGRRFAVLLSGVGLATAHARMEGLRRRCATDIVVHEGRELRFTIAMGVASFPHTAATQDDLVIACAAALREAQKRGGNHVALAAIQLLAKS